MCRYLHPAEVISALFRQATKFFFDDPDGNMILKIPTAPGDSHGSNNNTFAGRDGRTFFITGPSNSITAIRMRVKGSDSRWHGHDCH